MTRSNVQLCDTQVRQFPTRNLLPEILEGRGRINLAGIFKIEILHFYEYIMPTFKYVHGERNNVKIIWEI